MFILVQLCRPDIPLEKTISVQGTPKSQMVMSKEPTGLLTKYAMLVFKLRTQGLTQNGYVFYSMSYLPGSIIFLVAE